jgi:TrmH family RNA methyltransferase
MISKNQIKNITALHMKKFRKEHRMFIAEGEKVVSDLLKSTWRVDTIFATGAYFQRMKSDIRISPSVEIVFVTEEELKKISALTTPQHVLAVAEIPEEAEKEYINGLHLVLDGISDPGNMGTLIRTADWFGIDEIICSHDTVDCFNPKVVQATMGSLFRVNIVYTDLEKIFSRNQGRNQLPVYGSTLNGKNIYHEKLVQDAFIVAGNESGGIGSALLKYFTHPVTIPRHEKSSAESLNVAIATGIVCAEFRRK